MTKEQFKQLKVGDVVEYNSKGILEGCQFIITTLHDYLTAEGTVTKKGSSGGLVHKYEAGRAIASHYEYISLVTQNDAKSEPFATLELSVQEAAVILTLIRRVGGCPTNSVRKIVDSIHAKLSPQFASESIFNLCDKEMFKYTNYNTMADMSLEELDSFLIKEGFLKAPEKPKAAARHKTKGPDGKWAPKNYRVVTYPEHGTGKPVKRHVLWGDFAKGTAGTNVHVEEWCADSKKWCPKTYSLAKVGVVENN